MHTRLKHVTGIFIIFLTVLSASTQGRFPLKDCTKDATDVVYLLNYGIDQSWELQLSMIKYLNKELSQLSSGEDNSRWMKATVVDQFSAQNQKINVSGWRIRELDSENVLFTELDTKHLEIPTIDVKTLLEMKIQFVERLFNEIHGIRKEAIHVGVVFIDGTSLTRVEIRNVASIIHQRHTDVKIFVVITGSNLVEEIINLTDTIVLPTMDLRNFYQYLLMAVCKKCGDRSVAFEHKASINMISCYAIFPYRTKITWTNAMARCKLLSNSHLAVIETVEEMKYLQKTLAKKRNAPKDIIAISLHRDLSNYAKRFQWMTAEGRYRPLLINHWLPGKPCRDCIHTDCVAWQFTSHQTNGNDSSNVYENITLIEGWTDVNCNSKMISTVMCEVTFPRPTVDVDFVSNITVATEINNRTLENGHFKIYKTNIVSLSANIANSHFLQFLRDSDIHFPIFDCEEDANDHKFISYSLVCDFVDHCSNRQDELFCLNPSESLNHNKMYCTSGQRLHSIEYRCDNVKDCRDGSDEEDCLGSDCASLRCQDGSCLPLNWLNDGEFDCFIQNDSCYDCMVSDESIFANTHLINNKSCALVCNHNTCIEESQLVDEVKNCVGPERLLAEIIEKLKPANTCRNTFGHFVWAPKCYYFKDRYGGIIGCRDMSHLIGCENFECDEKFTKCNNSYCIPHRYVRDGKADCPSGEDEQRFYTGPCTGYFACWDSDICLHPDLVCDGRNDCPHDDDELDCHVSCPEGFRCVAGTTILSDYNRSVPLDIRRLFIDLRTRYLDLSGVELYGFDSFVWVNTEVFLNLKVLILSNCNISELYKPWDYMIYKKLPPSMIQKLDISYNRFVIFSKLEYNNYYKNIDYLNISYNRQLTLVRNLRFSFLEIIDLSYTSIAYLNDSVFGQLPRLKHLNLSHTLITDFTRRYFRLKFTLQTLDLRSILTEDLDDYSFHGLTISQALYTDHFQICCPQIQDLVITSQACIAPVDVESVSSCSDLLGHETQRFLLWVVAVLAIVGNTTVIVYRVTWDTSVLKTGYGLFVTNLGVSDFIMGVYLFMIAGADHFYRDNYFVYDKKWRESVVCKIAGFLACLSCEASTFFVFLITVDRFLWMKFPFGQMKCSMYSRITAVVTSWVASFLLSLVPIVFSFDIYSTNAMCLGLPLTNHQVTGLGYSIGVFIICNLIMFLFIAYGQFAIFHAMSEKKISKTTTNISNSRRAKEIIVAKQLSLVVLSNFLFWFPVGLMGLMSLGGYEVSSGVYGWTAVLLLPINSAANPILYTIPVLMDQWEKFKHGDHRM